MELIPAHILYRIELTTTESKVFFRKLPSEKDIQLFAHIISDKSSNIRIKEQEDIAVIEVEIQFDVCTTVGEMKSSAKRIKQDIESFIDED